MTKINEKMPESSANVKRRWFLDYSGLVIQTTDSQSRMYIVVDETSKQVAILFGNIAGDPSVISLLAMGLAANKWGDFPDEVIADLPNGFCNNYFAKELSKIDVLHIAKHGFAMTSYGRVERIVGRFFVSLEGDLKGVYSNGCMDLQITRAELDEYTTVWLSDLEQKFGGKNVK